MVQPGRHLPFGRLGEKPLHVHADVDAAAAEGAIAQFTIFFFETGVPLIHRPLTFFMFGLSSKKALMPTPRGSESSDICGLNRRVKGPGGSRLPSSHSSGTRQGYSCSNGETRPWREECENY